jgi:hypothetical protein
LLFSVHKRSGLQNDDRIGVNAGGQEIAGHLVVITESIHAGKDVERYGKSA